MIIILRDMFITLLYLTGILTAALLVILGISIIKVWQGRK